jgi:hypothetical protein
MKALVFSALCLLASPLALTAAPAPPTHLTVTDVSAKAFNVVWHSSPGTLPEIQVFSDVAGTVPVSGLATTAFPFAKGDDLVPAESSSRGLLSIGVAGLAPDTTYSFRVTSRSTADDSATVGPLRQVRTARQTGLVRSTAPFTAFANPVVTFQGVTEDGERIDVSAVVLASVPNARSPITTAVGLGDEVWLDFNNLISETTGGGLPIHGAEPLTLTILRGHGKSERFNFFAPASDGLADIRDPWLTPESLRGPVIAARSSATGASRIFMEFPVTKGRFYQIERSPSLINAIWQAAGNRVEAASNRLFWEDNGRAGTTPPPSATDRMFYRAREIDPANP